MYTYIIESQGYYKIGRAENVLVRLKSYDTHNPLYKVVKVYYGDYEEWLHVIFRKKHSHLEWYKIDQNDIDTLHTVDMPIEVSMEQVEKECTVKVYTQKQIKDILERQIEEQKIKKVLKNKINKILAEANEGHPYGGRNGVFKNTYTGQPEKRRKPKTTGIVLTKRKNYEEE